MAIELTIHGRVESLHLEPGDRVLVTLDNRHVSAQQLERLRAQIVPAFPDNEVVIVANGLRITRETHAPPPPKPGPDRLIERF